MAALGRSWMCKVRFWRWLFGNEIQISPYGGVLTRSCSQPADGESGGEESLKRQLGDYLTESVYKVVWQKSGPAQICQLILYIRNNKG